jgi:hypothetical protein
MAQGIAGNAADAAAGPLQAFFGGSCSGADCALSLVEYAIDRFQLIVAAVAAFAIVRNGFTLIYSSQEEEREKSKKAIGVTLAGVMLAFLTPRFIEAFFTAGGDTGVLASQGGANAGAQILSAEVFGVLRWVLTLFATICILLVIITGVNALTRGGSEEGSGKLKNALISIGAAGILLISAEAIKATLGIPDFGVPGQASPVPIILRAVQIISGILGIIGLVALAVVVYAGLMMILSAGNEEQFKKAKGLILRAGLGLVIILISYLLATFIASLLA